LVHFSPQIGLLVAKFCKDYPENELAKFHVFRSLPAPPQILPWSSGAPDERGPLFIERAIATPLVVPDKGS